eukprot:403118-Pelagomonas_calceolata.AAC.3
MLGARGCDVPPSCPWYPKPLLSRQDLTMLGARRCDALLHDPGAPNFALLSAYGSGALAS